MKKLAIVSLCLLFGFHLNAQVFEYRNYDWKGKLTKPTLNSEEAKESDIVMEENRVVEYIYNSKDELERYSFFHRTTYINEDKGIEENNKIYLSVLNPENLIAFKARTLSPKGKITEMFKGDLKTVTEDERQYMKLAVEGVEKGSIVEYFYILKTDLEYFGTEYVQGSTHKKMVEISIISPENLIFEAKGYNGFPKFQDTLLNKKHFLSAKVSPVGILQEEPYTLEEANLMRIDYKLAKNTIKDKPRLFTWADAGIRYYNIFHNKEDKGKEIKKLISELNIKDEQADEEKIIAVENYIKSNFNMMEARNNETSDEIIKSKYGSKFGLTKLYIEMLDQLNIKHELVLTCNRYSKHFDAEFDTWNFFEDYLIYFPKQKKYLCPANFLYRYGLLPYHYLQNNGLFIKEVALGEVKSGVGAVKVLDNTDLASHYDNMDVNITFQDNMDSVFMNYTKIMNGYSAISLRPYYFYAPIEKRNEVIDDYLKQTFENTKVKKMTVENFDLSTAEGQKPFTIKTNSSSAALIEKSGSFYLFKVGEVIGKQSQMYQEKKRKSVIDVGYPHSYTRNIKISIPKNLSIKDIEKLKINIAYKNNKGEDEMGFVSIPEIKGNELIITVKEYYNQLKLDPSRIEDFRKVINAAADFNKLSVLMEKKN